MNTEPKLTPSPRGDPGGVCRQVSEYSASKGRNTLARLSSAAAAVLVVLPGAFTSAEPVDAPLGLWHLPRHDAQNTGRATVAGDFADAPREIWSFGAIQEAYSFLRRVTLGGSEAYFAVVRSTLWTVRPDGSRVWYLPNFGASSVVEVFDFGPRGSGALVITGNSGLALVDVATGNVAWRWRLPAGTASLGGPKVWKRGEAWRLALFPQGTLEGQCWEFTASDEPARLLWKQEYPNRYWANFGPFPVIADMDNDGREDIVLAGKPSYLAVIDSDSGAVKFDLHYPIAGEDGLGRPYGLIQAVDLDGDGYPMLWSPPARWKSTSQCCITKAARLSSWLGRTSSNTTFPTTCGSCGRR
jgi:hypothetical protein